MTVKVIYLDNLDEIELGVLGITDCSIPSPGDSIKIDGKLYDVVKRRYEKFELRTEISILVREYVRYKLVP